MKNEEKGGNSLSLKDCQKIADDFSFLLKKWSATGVISLTGGDPLLYPDFFELFEYLNKTMPKGIRIEILGNPELLDEQTVSRLARLNPYRYQVSVDGLEKTHDGIRHSGSFQSTLNALHLLKKHGIKTTVMFTVSNENIRELVPVIDLVAEKQVDFFDFSRFSPLNPDGKMNREGTLIDPQNYRNLLISVGKAYESYKGCITKFGKKDPLWALLDWELGIFKPAETKLIAGGCNIGGLLICILHDGLVLGCRRVPFPIGKVPEQKLIEIFIQSEKLNEMRQIRGMQKCRECSLLNYCRGCRAVAYGYCGDFFASDPQCWL